jgi:hypothetical protein
MGEYVTKSIPCTKTQKKEFAKNQTADGFKFASEELAYMFACRTYCIHKGLTMRNILVDLIGEVERAMAKMEAKK